VRPIIGPSEELERTLAVANDTAAKADEGPG